MLGGKIGFGEIALIVGVALLFFGPSKLPELGKAVGKSIREFKGAIKETTDQVTEAVQTDVKSIAQETSPGRS